MPSKKEIEDGSAVEVSTPTAGVRVAGDPAQQGGFELARIARCTGPISSGWLADDDHPVESAEVAAVRARRGGRAPSSRQRATADELAADSGAEFGQYVRIVA